MYFGAYWALGTKRAKFISKEVNITGTYYVKNSTLGLNLQTLEILLSSFSMKKKTIFLLCKRKRKRKMA